MSEKTCEELDEEIKIISNQICDMLRSMTTRTKEVIEKIDKLKAAREILRKERDD